MAGLESLRPGVNQKSLFGGAESVIKERDTLGKTFVPVLFSLIDVDQLS